MGWGIREGPNEPITRCRPSTVIAFKLRGRLRVIVAMPSEMSTVTVVVIVVGRVRWRHNESEEGVETRKHILAGQPLRTGRIRHLSAPGIEIPKSGTVGLFLDQRRAETTRHLNTPPCRSFMKLCLQVQLTFTVDFSWISQKFHSTTAAGSTRALKDTVFRKVLLSRREWRVFNLSNASAHFRQDWMEGRCGLDLTSREFT